jgi:photosystem II stability/assembly factor-like uncharacterized protein
MTTRPALIGLIATMLLAVAGCGDSDDATTTATDPGIEHVHGLGVDPADNTLYAATHFGLFRLPENGPAERVGDNYQDTMGFTVVGPNRFLGSGHPDLQDPDLPPLLGLIESTNAGRNWKSLSLLGEADFHALSFRHGSVYGYDATNQRFMVSRDRTTWQTRSQPADLIAFAVDPGDADHVLATTSTGGLASTDGGRTWTSAPSPIVVLSWADDGTLAGVGVDGGLYLSADSGVTWEQTGELPGPPEAFLVVDSRTLVAAVQDLGLYESTDSGVSWNLRHRDQPS